jgi:sodium/potassium-transporting ATPase subunit alpha
LIKGLKIIHFFITFKTNEQSGLDLTKDVKITEHLMSLTALSEKLKTNLENGLTENEATRRLKRDGPNAFTPPKQTPGWVLYIRELTAGFALLLWFASIASFIAYAIEKVDQDVSDS